MNEMEGVVIRIENNNAIVETGPRAVGCGRCFEPGGCGGGLQNGQESRKSRQYHVGNFINASVGDHVLICVPAGSILKSALLSYGLPLSMLIFGTAMATWLYGSDSAALIGGLSGLAAGLALLRFVALGREPLLSLRFKSTDSLQAETMCFERNITT